MSILPQNEVSATVDREIGQDDLEAWKEAKGPREQKESLPIGQVRDRHHWLARLMAAGYGPTKAALQIGMHPNWASILQDDPTFKELLAEYREQAHQKWDGFLEEMVANGFRAELEIADRLQDEETRQNLTIKELNDIARTRADRTGRGPSSKTEHEHRVTGLEDLTPEEREALAKDIRDRWGDVIEHEASKDE